MNSAYNSALFHYETLKRGTTSYEFHSKQLDVELKRGNLTYSDIGTHEEDLYYIRRACCILKAQEALDKIAQGDKEYHTLWHVVEEELKSFGLPLGVLNITMEDVMEYRKKACITNVKNIVELLRKGTPTYATLILSIEFELNREKLTLSDVGLTSQDLLEFRKNGSKLRAKQALCDLELGLYNASELVEVIYQQCKVGGFSLEEIGTSEEKISSFVK